MNNPSVIIVPPNGSSSQNERELVETIPDSFTINPSFMIQSARYIVIEDILYTMANWHRLLTAFLGDTSEFIIFALNLASTVSSVLRNYDAVIVSDEELANELCEMSGRLQFIGLVDFTCRISIFGMIIYDVQTPAGTQGK